MAEDYTYTTEPTRAQLAARVRELEAQLNAAIVGGARLERENAELRAKLDAVPVDALRFWWDPFTPGAALTSESIAQAGVAIEAWLKTYEPPPADEPDAPLTLAAIDDEDGDL